MTWPWFGCTWKKPLLRNASRTSVSAMGMIRANAGSGVAISVLTSQ